METITKRRLSSTGPDGIPFSVYSNLADIAGPLLYRFCLHLSLGKRANASFNYSNLHFFPKDSTNTVDRLRPISVNNTDNRLVANIVRKCITPAIADILDEAQRSFVPDGTIEQNVEYLNGVIYGKPATGESHTLS
jgi:hypothetical protein